MKAVKIRFGNKEITGLLGNNGVAIKIPPNALPRIKNGIDRFTYGITVTSDGQYIYFYRSPRSGLTEEGKQVIKKIAPQYAKDVDKNQIPLYILLVIAGFVALCNAFPDAPLCKEITGTLKESWWNVFAPLLSFAVGAYIGYWLVSRG